MKIILVEDNPEKASQIEAIVFAVISGAKVERCMSLASAAEAIDAKIFDLLILDISMDIALGGNGFIADNHDMLGGLRFAKELYLNENELTTIVVTAHESFIEKKGPKAQISSFMSVARLSQEFEDLLGELFIGAVRYQKDGWSTHLRSLLEKVGKS